MSRYRASLIHLLISAVPVGIVIAVVAWVWYPGPAFEVAGALSIVQLLVLLQFAVGPLLTLLVYRQGKPGLAFDLSIILLLQIAAFAYGSYRLYDERPHYIVFSVDRLEFVSRKQIDRSAIRYDELQAKRFAELVPVYARVPEDAEEYLKLLEGVLFGGEPDLENRAEYWEPWAAGADAIRNQLTPIAEVRTASPREQKILQQAIDDFSPQHPNLGVLPIGGIERDIGMILDRDALEILGVLDVNPWALAAP